MLTLIEGGLSCDLHGELLARIKKSIDEGRKSLLIVPESQTVRAEGEMCRVLSPKAVLCFEVTNFTRLANTVFRTYGGLSGEYCSTAKRSLIMWKVLSELAKEGDTKTPIQYGTVEKTLEAIRDMQSLGITAENLANAEDGAKSRDKRLSGKLRHLSLAFSAYKATLSEKYSDLADDLIVLAKKLDMHPEYFREYEIFIEDFTSFTKPQYEIIARLISVCAVTVSIDLPHGERDAFEYTETFGTREKLLRLADKCGVKKGTVIAPYCPGGNLLANEISRYLWRTNGTIDNSCLHYGAVEVYEADTPFDECDFVATDIARRVKGGAKYSDFTIVARQADSYIGIIDTAFSRADVPHFISKRQGINSYEAIKLIAAAYSSISCGFRKEDVLSYAKCAMSGVSREACDEFELYVEKWNISGQSFVDGEIWNMNPDGYTFFSDNAKEKLLRINHTKQALLKPITEFGNKANKELTVREHASLLCEFLLEIGLEAQLSERAEELRSLGEELSAQENERLWQIICDSLDTVVEVLSECVVSAEVFHTLLSVVFSEASLGNIPTHKDEVTVISADAVRVRDYKYVYLLGVNTGEFPSYAKDNSYFTEREKQQLSSLGLPIEPDLDKKAARELYMLSRAISSSRESVTLLYARKNTAGKELQPSDAIERISSLTDKKIKPVKISSLPLSRLIFTAEDALAKSDKAKGIEIEDIDRALIDCGYKDAVSLASLSTKNDNLSISEDGLGFLYKDDLYLSQSRIETFLNCPMNYFCKYNLRLDEGERAELGHNIIGSFVHSILENFFATVKEEDIKISELSDTDKAKITKKSAEKYIRETFSGSMNQKRVEVAIARLTRAAMPVVEGLCDEFSNCDFKPVFFELKTDNKSPMLPNPVVFDQGDRGRVIINGTVDRVDAFKNGDDVYVRVIDYKTGTKEFSPTDMKEGKNLQMFLYLRAICETDKPGFREAIGASGKGELIPAGVIYVKAQVKDVTVPHPDDALATAEVKKIQEREGMLLSDTDSISAMNSNYLPIKFKDGDVDPKSAKYLYSINDWERITEDIREVISCVASDMRGGKIPATNTDKSGESTCGYCGYRSVCRNYKPKKFFN